MISSILFDFLEIISSKAFITWKNYCQIMDLVKETKYSSTSKAN